MGKLPFARRPGQMDRRPDEVRRIFESRGSFFDLLIVRDAGLGDIIYTSIVAEGLHRVYSALDTEVRITFGTQRPYFDYLKRLPFIHSCVPLELSPQMATNYTLAINLCRAVDFLPVCDQGHRLDLLAEKAGLKDGDLNYKWRPDLLPEEETLSESMKGLGEGRKIVGMGVTSASHIRTWDYGPQLVSLLVAAGYHVFIFEKDEKPEYSGKRYVTNLSGKLNISRLIGAVKACDCCVVTDSGIMHVAAAFEIPYVAIFGPINPDFRLRYYSVSHKVLFPDGLRCAPCWDWQKHHCEGSSHYKMCMRLIMPGQIVEAVDGLLY